MNSVRPYALTLSAGALAALLFAVPFAFGIGAAAPMTLTGIPLMAAGLGIGVIAAAGVYALENNVDRLAEDHATARRFAEGLDGVSGIEVWPVETNLVFFNVKGTGLTAHDFHERLLERGVRIGVKNDNEMRAVTHLDVSMAQVERAVDAVAGVVARA